LSTLIHNCQFKNWQSALAQYWIGRVAQYSIGADSGSKMRWNGVKMLDQFKRFPGSNQTARYFDAVRV
jgi:hypothetical protein